MIGDCPQRKKQHKCFGWFGNSFKRKALLTQTRTTILGVIFLPEGQNPATIFFVNKPPPPPPYKTAATVSKELITCANIPATDKLDFSDNKKAKACRINWRIHPPPKKKCIGLSEIIANRSWHVQWLDYLRKGCVLRVHYWQIPCLALIHALPYCSLPRKKWNGKVQRLLDLILIAKHHSHQNPPIGYSPVYKIFMIFIWRQYKRHNLRNCPENWTGVTKLEMNYMQIFGQQNDTCFTIKISSTVQGSKKDSMCRFVTYKFIFSASHLMHLYRKY